MSVELTRVRIPPRSRRQKEKRESSCSSSITSTGSDPKDLDGVVLSFSSSPLPSPVLPLHPTAGSFSRSAPSGGPKDSVASATAAGAPAFSGASVAPSGRLVLQSTTAAADKENVKSPTGDAAGVRASHLLTPVSSATVPYRYSYPSQHSGHASSTGEHPSSSGSHHPEASHANVFVHRPHNSSIIAAKKHVRKRPLGSHAPLARTPSLPHSFAFPPSPPRSSSSQQVASSSSARRTLQRSASHSLNAVAGREQKKSAAGLFANSQGETVAHAADRRRSLSVSPTASAPTTLHNNDYPGALTSSRRTGSPEPAAAAPVPMAMMTPVSKARARDELLQHMQSDPPSTSSPGPIPLTRRRIEQLERSLANHEDEDSDEEEIKSGSLAPPKYAAGTARPQVARSLSSPNTQATLALHSAQLTEAHTTFRTPSHARASSVPARSANAPPPPAPPSSSSPAPTAFGPSATHAGADLGICALKALGRKRARILEDQSSAAAAAAAVVGNVSARGRTYTHALGLTSGGRRLGLTIDVARASSGGSQQQKRRRVSGGSAVSSVGTDDSSLADLSYSSTSTASTADSLQTVADNVDYFALSKRSSTVSSSTSRAREEPPKSPEDEQRECAELLLGLGGGFH